MHLRRRFQVFPQSLQSLTTLRLVGMEQCLYPPRRLLLQSAKAGHLLCQLKQFRLVLLQAQPPQSRALFAKVDRQTG
ncbi:hypothetical protein D3C78_1858810 [compost metagenome]